MILALVTAFARTGQRVLPAFWKTRLHQGTQAMVGAARLRSEREFHDQQARARAADFLTHPERLRFTDDA